jgi:hypothetical protein
MNKKKRIAMVLLVVAIVLSLISIVLNASIDDFDDSGVEDLSGQSMATEGTVQLTIRPQGTVSGSGGS